MNVYLLDFLRLDDYNLDRRIKIVDKSTIDRVLDCDAIVTSTSFCGRFGWSVGKDGANLGKMFVFENTRKESFCGIIPRYFISNVNWQVEPPLVVGTRNRLEILGGILREMKDSGKLIRGEILIDFDAFIPLKSYPDDEREAIKELEDGLLKLNRL